MRFRCLVSPLLLVVPALALADDFSFRSRVSTQISATAHTDDGYGPVRTLKRDEKNASGSVSMANTNMQFPSGYMTARSHGCAAVPVEAPGGASAFGSASTFFADTLYLRSDTLPFGTAVEVSFCFDLAYDFYTYSSTSTFSDPTVGAGLSMRFGINTNSGFSAAENGEAGQDGKGKLYHSTAYMANPTTKVYTLTMQVGMSYANILGELGTSTGTTAKPGEAGKGGASSSMTFGAHAPAGTYFYSGNLGTAWDGKCGGALGVLPPTPAQPVPEPASLAALGMGAVALMRRRRA